jgi:hypothetical protein
MLIRAWLCITLIENFFQRTARGIRQLGYAPKVAAYYAGLFSILMTSVCGLFGLLDGSPEVLYRMGNGAGISDADARSGPVLSAAFRIRRH